MFLWWRQHLLNNNQVSERLVQYSSSATSLVDALSRKKVA